MAEYRFILQPYKGINTRYDCPGCGKRKKFTRYIDTETGDHLHESVGRCNRESNCGYQFTPKQYFEENGIKTEFVDKYAHAEYSVNPTQKPISFIPMEIFKQSRACYGENHFITFLKRLFSDEMAIKLIEKYHIGTSKHWPGATIFWQIDKSGKLRTGKIMLYNSDTGKRVKEPYNHFTWAHALLKITDFNLKQCFFGEHLLKSDPEKTIAIVESEKTAVIASVYLPEFIWLATGGLSNLSPERSKVLKNRNVILFPDIKGFDKWNEKGKELTRLVPGTWFNISDLLERKATETERQQGLDLADYLIRFGYKEFQQQEQPEHQQKAFKQPQPQEIPQVQELPSNQLFELDESDTINNRIITEMAESFDKKIPAWVAKNGKLFIKTPCAETYTVYPGVTHYNERLCIPVFEGRENVMIESLTPVFIDLKTLTINIKTI